MNEKAQRDAGHDSAPPGGGTGYVYDPVFLKHSQAGHPERPERLTAVMDELDRSGLLGAMQQIPSRPAEAEELALVHSDTHIARVRQASRSGGGYLDPDTYTNRHSYDAGAVAAGSLIDLTQAVSDGRLRNGFAMMRPPGHHAMPMHTMGFCLFCHVALAVQAVRKSGKTGRVAIVDFDVHHGNGTQAVFQSDPDVLYVSTHQFPHFPGTGRLDEIGDGAGKGATVNLPLSVGVGDAGFELLYREVVLPALKRFEPELILVSAGYDAHWSDPLAGLNVSLSAFARLSGLLVECAERLCERKIVFTLEGGYDLEAVSHGVANSIKALLGRDDFNDPLGAAAAPEPDLSEYVATIKRIHSLPSSAA